MRTNLCYHPVHSSVGDRGNVLEYVEPSKASWLNSLLPGLGAHRSDRNEIFRCSGLVLQQTMTGGVKFPKSRGGKTFAAVKQLPANGRLLTSGWILNFRQCLWHKNIHKPKNLSGECNNCMTQELQLQHWKTAVNSCMVKFTDYAHSRRLIMMISTYAHLFRKFGYFGSKSSCLWTNFCCHSNHQTLCIRDETYLVFLFAFVSSEGL